MTRRPKNTTSVWASKAALAPAIVELEIALNTMKTNIPINEREGNKDQAQLERDNAKSFEAAIQILETK